MKRLVSSVLAVASAGVAFGLIRTAFVPGAARAAKPALPRAADSPLQIGDNAWASQAAFMASGARCGTRSLTPLALQAVDRALTRAGFNLQAAASAANAGSGAQISPGGKGALAAPLPRQIEVYVHVITATSPTGAVVGDVSDARIAQQIRVLNNAYAGLDRLPDGTATLGAPTVTPFVFRLAQTDRTINNAWYAHRPGTRQEAQMKTALHRGSACDLNLYLCDLDSVGLLGYATFPSDYAYNPSADGVVVTSDSLPGIADPLNLNPYDLGDTATHEVGHWLGLYHTFQGGCATRNDAVADTPAEATPFSGALPRTLPDTCSSARFPGRDSIENFMNYGDDSLIYRFTPGQLARMQANASNYRGM